MEYMTLEANINHGLITVADPAKLPETGKALLTVINGTVAGPDWDKVTCLLGTAQGKMDGLTIERESREEWDKP